MRASTPAPQPIAAASTSLTAFVGKTRFGPLDRPVQISSAAEFGVVFGGLWSASPLSFAIQLFFESGGQTAIVARIASPDATATTPGGSIDDADLAPREGVVGQQGIYLLERQMTFDLLVIPPYDWDRGPAPSTWAAAAEFCEARRAFLLVDPTVRGASGTSGAIRKELAALEDALPREIPGAKNAACYFPRLLARNALAQKDHLVAPAGAIAGMMARIDAAAGVWTAPAGNDAVVRGVVGLERALSARELSDLASLGVNGLRDLPATGVVAWGSRTWQGADGIATDWKYVSVRRLALFLEKSIEQGTRWARFEENDEPLWERIRLDVVEFLHSLFRRGAFQGQMPDEAFFARCGADTTTQQEIDQGVVNIQIGFAPLRPADFVIVEIRQLAGQTDG